jgi:hypothetical protein
MAQCNGCVARETNAPSSMFSWADNWAAALEGLPHTKLT